MRIYIDDGSTHIKMLWEQHGRTITHISPNSFKRGWSATFDSGKPFNYTAGKEKYSFDLISPDKAATKLQPELDSIIKFILQLPKRPDYGSAPD